MSDARAYADGFLRLSQSEGIARLTLANPRRKNAITAAMWQAIPAILQDLAADPDLRVLVLAGAGGEDFSAGADISEFSTVRRNAETAQAYESDNSRAFAEVRRFPLPVIAAIRGICYGGAFGLAAACDLRLVSKTARFSIPPAKLGLAYPADAVRDIVTLLGPGLSRRALYTASVFTAADLAATDFVDALVEDSALEQEVDSLAGTISRNAPLSIRASKLSIRAACEADPSLLDDALRLGQATFDSEDYAEGRRAFAEKRAPVFIGR